MSQNPNYASFATSTPGLPTSVSPEERVIIHHLSDLHRGRTTGGRHALENYSHRLFHLKPEEQPQLLIITGDLTQAGTRDELHEAAAEIRNMTVRWDELTRRQRVFIVPGPHDIDWANLSDKTSSFETFAQELYGFCTPILPGRDGKTLSNADPYFLSSNDHVLVYLINTCFTQETLPQPTPKQLDELVKKYKALWKERAKAQAKPAVGFDDLARWQFLKSTEELLLPDTGVVRAADVERFTRTLQALRLEDTGFAASYPGDEAAHLLKIVVSHHPLIGFTGRSGRPYAAAQDAGALLREARRFGFQVALHGHTHEPHVLSDMPLDMGSLGETPLLQIGAGSLGGTPNEQPTFNEMVAIRNRASGRWTLQLAPLNPGQESPRKPFIFALSPQGEMSKLHTGQVAANSAETRQKFENRLRVALRLLAEEVENELAPEIPVRPLETIKDTIKEIIFAGVETRVGLALKTRQPDGSIVLSNRYIVPDVQLDDQYFHPFPYPDTIAAWALIQGDAIIFPRQVQEAEGPINYDLLRRNNKYEPVQRLLREASQRNPSDARLAELHAKFDNGQLRLGDIFAPWPTGVQPTRFASFISVPIPMRPASAYNSTRPREVGVLTVDIVDADPAHPGAAFTEDRVDMLRTLAYFIDVILTTADKFRRPRGVWTNA